jgi:phosphoribosylamine--glycine ligase
MNVLLVGSGAREHALAWKLSQSPLLKGLHAAPGNPGIGRHARRHDVAPDDVLRLVSLAKRERIDLVVVGPEGPLVAGLADALSVEGIPVFGPRSAAAQIEGSKSFAKQLMVEAGVPTARFGVFDDADQAEAFAVALPRAVVKADGLAAGKGVIVAADAAEAKAAVSALLRQRILGEASRRVVVEEFLEGEEVSVIALCDGARYLLLPSAQDHKQLLDGDRGPNTGGMGAYSPAPVLPDEEARAVGEAIIRPVLDALARRGTPFVGALYAGLMMTAKGPRVLEFNARLGDPETQPLVMRLEGDLLPVLAAAAAGDLSGQSLTSLDEAAVGVVLAASGYPTSPRTGDPIRDLDKVRCGDDLQIFHAGTREEGGRLLTAGGRVLTVCALGRDVRSARTRAYDAVSTIRFDGMVLRRDIASRALERS